MLTSILRAVALFILFTNRDNVIFPKEMSIVLPLINSQYQVNSLSEVYIENGLYYLNIRNLNKSLKHAFFFDGGNLYFFVDEVVLTVGDEKIELSPMSYVNCLYKNFIEYYDKKSDTFGTIDLVNQKVTVSNDYMTVDVASDKVIYEDNFFLLTKNFSYLSKITDVWE